MCLPRPRTRRERFLFPWLGLQMLIDESDGTSLALKIIIDAVANFGTATCMLEDMVTASGL